MRPRVVTGFGVLSALGVGRSTFEEGLRAGTRPAAKDGQLEVPGFDPAAYLGDKGLRSLDRLTKMMVVTARLALKDAGIKDDGAWKTLSAERVGLVVSNAYGSLEAMVEIDRVASLEDARYINPSRFPLTVSNSAAGYVSIWEELRALNVSVSDGNCGALDAIACADVFLEQGRADALLVGGAEAASEALLLAFQRLEALESGAVLGEAAALVAVEPRDVATARGAAVLGELVGYGTAFEAPEREAQLVHASAAALERAIADALSDANVSPKDVDVVVSGVSGLRAFDEAELRGIANATRGDVCVLAPKRALGETLGAGGALGILTALGCVAQRDVPRPSADLAVRGALRTGARTAVVTSMGFYGNASALVIQAATR